jgi:hypothetical protein
MLIACSLDSNLTQGWSAVATISFGDPIIEIGVAPSFRTVRQSGPRLRKRYSQKISGDQILRPPASAHVDLGGGGAYPITVGIERVQKTRLIRTGMPRSII